MANKHDTTQRSDVPKRNTSGAKLAGGRVEYICIYIYIGRQADGVCHEV
jgi:hypothetical protein